MYEDLVLPWPKVKRMMYRARLGAHWEAVEAVQMASSLEEARTLLEALLVQIQETAPPFPESAGS